MIAIVVLRFTQWFPLLLVGATFLGAGCYKLYSSVRQRQHAYERDITPAAGGGGHWGPSHETALGIFFVLLGASCIVALLLMWLHR